LSIARQFMMATPSIALAQMIFVSVAAE